MATEEILEKKEEKTTENNGAQNDSADNSTTLADVAQNPVESDGGEDSGAAEEENDPGMGPVISQMLEEPPATLPERAPVEKPPETEILKGHEPKKIMEETEEIPERAPVEKPPETEIRKEHEPKKILKETNVPEKEKTAPQELTDEISNPMFELVKEIEGGDMVEGADQDGAFDSLQELKKLKNEQPDEKTETDETTQTDAAPDENGNVPKPVDKTADVLKKIVEARRGNVYAAVVLAKGLQNNESNPFTSAGYQRRSRFMNNSKLNKALEVNKMAGSVQGMLASAVPGLGKSKLFNAFTIGTNLLAVVGSVRDLMKKIRMYKSLPKKDSPGMDEKKTKDLMRTKAFTVLGMISDGVMLLNKLCGIAKAVANMCSKDNLTAKAVAKVSGYVSLALGGATQLMGLASNVNQMLKVKEDIRAAEKAKEEKGEEVDKIWDKYLPATRAGTDAAKERLKAKKESAKNTDGKKKEEEDPNSDKNLYTGDRAYIAVRLLERDDVDEEDKDVLSEYLRMERKIGRLDDQFKEGIYGLVTLSTGLMATITGSVNAAYDVSGVENPTAKQKSNANIASNVNAAAGVVSGSIAMVNLGRGFVKGWNKDPDSQGDLLKQRARGVVEELQDDKYGLKGIQASFLADPQGEHENVKNALDKYAAADKRLKSLGVKYPALMKASNVKEFDAALVADI